MKRAKLAESKIKQAIKITGTSPHPKSLVTDKRVTNIKTVTIQMMSLLDGSFSRNKKPAQIQAGKTVQVIVAQSSRAKKTRR
ncbi:histidine kinase-, DNA gyrase B-, and HSP90-like ATPase family protein [Fructobacillus ficulneus]|uniref:Histidine kinase-, DNA gyrase B-, and HSP90-like ATPase family protein n=1 Tax=Fructobacillus ficulneus TaxID=157463 RepID=A0A0K8MII9_9LACO|nr:histidine kinase-, DNA gyrase B-, and HSP90-like ATPase family protein [Fructobacillus ficulneus]